MMHEPSDARASLRVGVAGDGRLALAGLTPSRELWIREETVANSNVWSNWTRLSAAPGSVPIGRVAMAHNQSNRLQIFATTPQGQAYYRSQFAPGSQRPQHPPHR